MTHSEKRRWLGRYLDALNREKLLRDELEVQRQRAIGGSTAFDGMPGGTPDGQGLPRAVENILQAEQELLDQIAVCNAARCEVVAAIHTVPNAADQDILFRRYLLGRKWFQIAMDVNLSERQVYRRAEEATEQLKID